MCNAIGIIRDSFYKLKIKHQLFIGIISIITINLLFITSIITLNVFMMSNSAYKDVINTLDIQEFDQMSYFNMASEYANMHLSSMIADIGNLLGTVQTNLLAIKDIGRVDPNFSDMYYPNYIQHLDYYNSSSSGDKIVYFSPTRSRDVLQQDNNFQILLTAFKSLIPCFSASFYVNLFNVQLKNENSTFFENLIFVNYDLDVIFYFPGSNLTVSRINRKINLVDLKDYVWTKNFEMQNVIKTFQQLLAYKSNISDFDYDEMFANTPVYLERDIYPNFFLPGVVNLNTLSSNNLKYTNGTFLGNLFILSEKSSSDAIYDFLYYNVPALYILKIDYQYPYSPYNSFQCELIKYSHNYSYWDQNNYSLEGVSDCFDPTNRQEDYGSIYDNYSDRVEFLDSLDLFDSSDFPLSDSTKTVLLQKEAMMYRDFLYAHRSLLDRRVALNNMTFKVKKSFSPLSSYPMFSFNYPISYVYSTLIIKNEGLLKSNKHYFFLKSIANFICAYFMSLIICYTLLFVIVLNLVQMMTLIDKPLGIIKNAVQTISEKEKFNDAKLSMEKYIYDTVNDEVIDEFVDLITIILDMFEGNMNMKEEIESEKDAKGNGSVSLFSLVKINNLIVMEDKVLELVEKKNYLNDILKVSIEKEILTDFQVSQCGSFVSLYENYNRFFNKMELNKLRMNKIEVTEDHLKLQFSAIPFSKLRKVDKKGDDSPGFNGGTNNVLISPKKKGTYGCFTYNKTEGNNSSDYNSEDEDNILDIEDVIVNKITKLYTIKDQNMLIKLRRKDNSLYNAYSKLKNKNLDNSDLDDLDNI